MNWMDLTISREMMGKHGLSEEGLQTWLNANCHKWAYGRETGDAGFEHLQCRISTRKTLAEVISMFSRFGHVSPTHSKDFDYVLKDGNYVCSWKLGLEKYRDISLFPWQMKAKEALSLMGEREILVVIDPVGGSGKSWLARHLEASGLAKVIPKMDRAGDMISAAMINPSEAYVFDIPMAEEKRSVPFWSAIEQIKGGHLYDWRYQYRETWVEPPRIMVFTNKEPPWDYLAKDRWKVMRLSEEIATERAEPISASL